MENIAESRKKLKPDPVKCEICPNLIEPFFKAPRQLSVWEKVNGFLYHQNEVNEIGWLFIEKKCGECREKIINERSEKIAKEENLRMDSRDMDSTYVEVIKFPAHRSMTESKMSNVLKDLFEVYKSDFVSGKINLFITGQTGCGKTHLAVCLIKKFITEGNYIVHLKDQWPEVVPFTYFMDELRQACVESVGSDVNLINRTIQRKAILFDDIAAGRNNDFVVENLYKIVDRCWLYEHKGIIFTSNKSLDEISREMDDRISSRIAGLCKVIKIIGKDYRLK